MHSLATRGQRLWDSLLAQDAYLMDEQNPMREVALSACRTADRVEYLEIQATQVDAVMDGPKGPQMHPVFAEVRQQAALLARLVAALRLPDDASGKRPQKRQVRGVQQPSQITGRMPASERARLRSVGE